MEDLQKLKADVLPLKPVYEPYNDIAHQVLEQVLDMLSNVPTTSVNRNKYCLILSSILMVAQTLATQVKGGISIPKTKKVWYEYPRVSIKAIDRVRNDLLNNNIITQIPDTGRQHILQLEDGSWKNVGVQSVYSINDQVLKLKGLLDAEFIEVARPTVLVGEYEDWIVRKRRKDQGLRKPKMNTTKVKSKFGVLYRVTSKDIERLNTFYRDHPLALPRLDNGSQKYAACCTRIYHDGSMDSGGRLYGAWSDMGSHYRLQSTIDGETVVEIDLNASQPTLFSSLMGMKMDVGESWNDLPKLVEAIELSRETKATILASRLDRISRDVEFIAGLIKRVDFKVAQFPNADKFMLHIYAALAEQERDFISLRTREALKAAKARGVVLGGARPEANKRHEAVKKLADANAKRVMPIIVDSRKLGKSFRDIAKVLNDLEVKTAKGGRWHPSTVHNYANRILL